MPVIVKICGITDIFTALAAAEAGANQIGLVFYSHSPRYLDNDEAAEIANVIAANSSLPDGRGRKTYGEGVRLSGEGKILGPPSPAALSHSAKSIASPIRERVSMVGLFVDPTDEELKHTLAIVPLDVIQLHGKETPQRVAEIKSRFGLPVMKAISIGSAGDLDDAKAYEDVSDWLLFDAHPPKDSVLPGGNGMPFDWGLLAGRTWQRPWMLSGGLTPETVAEAIRISGATAVDVSSGVETSPGSKNVGLVRQFIEATVTV